MAKAQGAPVEEMQECAWACAKWLLDHGFFSNPFDDGEGPTLQPPDVISRLSAHINDDGQERARVVQTLLMWLDWQVLPAIDGRREAPRLVLEASAPRASVPDPKAMAELVYGNAEEKLAEQVRRIIAAQHALKSSMQKVLARQADRAGLARQRRPVELAHTYQLWLDAGEAVLKLLLSPGPTNRRAPRTIRDWNNARAAFEADLKQVGFTAAEVLKLMPQGGTKRALKARGQRARKRAAG